MAKRKIYWHDAFYEAIQLELAEYKDILEFKNEHHLSKEALKIDVVIIKKTKKTEIKKNVGKIFKEYNVLEYKSETDYLSISDYDKVNGYARLYAAFEKKANMKNITITFIVTRYPRELFKYIEKELNFEITEEQKGIYHIKGSELPIQIIKSDMLLEEENLYLKSLSSKLSPEKILNLFNTYIEQIEYNEKNIYLDRVLDANKTTIQEGMTVSVAEFKEMIMTGAEKNGWLDEFVEKATKKAEEKAVEVAKKLLKRGLRAEDIAEDTGFPIEKIIELQK